MGVSTELCCDDISVFVIQKEDVGMKIRGIIINTVIIVLVLSVTVFASGKWQVSVSEDVMTGTKIWYATSPRVDSLGRMGFPYGGTKAWIGIGYDGESEWIYIGFTNAPNLVDTTTRNGYDLIETRIKWDDDLETASFTQSWGSQFIHFRDYAAAIKRIEESNTVLIELDWYGEGKVHFEFPLTGSAAAIKEIRSAFK